MLPEGFLAPVTLSISIRPDKECKAELERLCGPDALEILAN